MLLLLCSAKEPKVSIGERQTGGIRVRNWREGTHTVVGLVYQAEKIVLVKKEGKAILTILYCFLSLYFS